jgi:phospholipase/carboxylesterase
MPTLLETVEIETGPAPRAAVLWMHGLGADGHDFVPVVPEMGLPSGLAVRFVFPHAPVRPVTINQGMRMRAWYDVRDDGGERREDEAGVRESQRDLEALIERERGRGIDATRIALGGFSQGGAMALHVGLRHPERLAGIAALSCFLPLAGRVAAEASPATRETPILMAHGVHDALISIARGRQARDVLAGLGYRVTWREYPMAHEVCPDEMRRVGQWLAGVLDAPGGMP